jgi:CheY-like chemotaxis protein
MTDLHPAILIVEDDVDVRMILQRFLRHLLTDHDILVVADGMAALTLLEERSVTLVFTDYCLPGMSGVQLAHHIKAQWPTTRIVLLSAMDAQFLIQQSQELGLEGVLTKPFTIEKVRTLLDAVLP